jgi:hypothetical protein
MSRDSKDEESFGFEKREGSPISQDWTLVGDNLKINLEVSLIKA